MTPSTVYCYEYVCSLLAYFKCELLKWQHFLLGVERNSWQFLAE